MAKLSADLQKFHDTFFPDRPRVKAPCAAPDDVVGMRLNFLLEELKELGEAHGFALTPSTVEGCNPLFTKFKDHLDAEASLDAVTDLLYVLVGTAELFGLFRRVHCRRCSRFINNKMTPCGLETTACGRTLLDEAWDRVQAANMQKVRVKSADDSKRGSRWDVKKPPGWRAPDLSDLVK